VTSELYGAQSMPAPSPSTVAGAVRVAKVIADLEAPGDVPQCACDVASAAAAFAIAAAVDAAGAAAAAASCRRRFSGIAPNTSEISSLLYLRLRHAMMPASSGWCTDVTFGGSGQIVTQSHSSLVCAPQLSTKRMTGERALDHTLGKEAVLNRFS